MYARLLSAEPDDADMKKLLGINLGIMTALGGFVDFGQIVFTAWKQACATG